MTSVDIFVVSCSFFFFNDTATTEIYTLSLHDALPISWRSGRCSTGYVGRFLPMWTRSLTPDRKSTRLNSSHVRISYAVFCLKKKIAVEEFRRKYVCFAFDSDPLTPLLLVAAASSPALR